MVKVCSLAAILLAVLTNLSFGQVQPSDPPDMDTFSPPAPVPELPQGQYIEVPPTTTIPMACIVTGVGRCVAEFIAVPPSGTRCQCADDQGQLHFGAIP